MGFLKPLKQNEHQVIVITLKGEIKPDQAAKFNELFAKLKDLLGDRMMTVSIDVNGVPIKVGHGGRPTKR